MDIYKEMYYKLFNKLTDLAEQIQEIQREVEEIFLSQDENSPET